MVHGIGRVAGAARADELEMLLEGFAYFPLLAAAVVIYWRLPNERNIRLAFLCMTSGVGVVYLLWSTLENRQVMAVLGSFGSISLGSYAIAARLARQRSKPWLVLGVSLPFTAFLSLQCGFLASCTGARSSWIVPVSVGFFVMRQVHFVYESYRGGIKRRGLLEFIAYVVYFPTIIAGPIERFPRFVEQIGVDFDRECLTRGAERILVGTFKKFVVADLLITSMLPPDELTRSGFHGVPWSVTIFACSMKFLYVYFDFSGYTDMAIGTSRLFGIRVMENFNFPLLRSNLAEFWRAWHMSLASMARDYVYFPLLVKYRHTVVALVATMLVIASWHEVSPGWLLWGLHHGIGLAVLAAFQRRAAAWCWLQPVRGTLGWRIGATMATLFFVTYGYALTWHPSDVRLSLSTYAKVWSLGLWS